MKETEIIDGKQQMETGGEAMPISRKQLEGSELNRKAREVKGEECLKSQEVKERER